MSEILRGLDAAARGLVADRAFRTGEEPAIDAAPYIVEDVGLGRGIDPAPLLAVVAHAMRRLRPEASDAWLAPRVHATVRLTRREAADRRIWSYLAAVLLPDYTRWRWRAPGDRGGPVAIDRFVGGAATNALSWLWWTAELTRDGGDYAPTGRALSGPWFVPDWLGLDAMHHRAAAQAVVGCLAGLGGGPAAGERGRGVVRALDLALRAIALDALAPADPPDAEAVREWCAAPADETVMIRRPPRGPDEPPVPAADVAAVGALLDEVAGWPGPTRRRAGRRRRTGSATA